MPHYFDHASRATGEQDESPDTEVVHCADCGESVSGPIFCSTVIEKFGHEDTILMKSLSCMLSDRGPQMPSDPCKGER